MADNSPDDSEKTEQATPKRLEEARKKGDIPRSRDLSSAAVMMAAGIGIYMMGGHVGTGLSELVREGLTISPDVLNYDDALPRALVSMAAKAMWICAPVLGLVMLAAAMAPLAMGGWSFSTAGITPDFSRLSPMAGFKRLFSLNSVVELVKSLAKFSVVAIVAVIMLRSQTGELLSLGSEPTQQAVVHAFKLCGQAFIALSSALLIIAGVDVPYQLWQYARKLRMSREEIKQEYKESEGSPEVKGRIRRLQQDMARRRMMSDVPKADVVVTNPTHFAVALRYDENRMRAPIVVAKGADEVAAKIRELAREHQVPMYEAPPLARVLHRYVDIGDEIPQRLYVAVAQVLTYVFQLRSAKRGLALMPDRPDLEVDEDASV
ncbi:MAG TPA: flagellar biosynthesis protein FlhB [Steroidobacteraceae bacterium]|nr:flagellar biosynthesis protein FlhB [Steroidobacteraceae bacterium]